jgi:hypothetical protein
MSNPKTATVTGLLTLWIATALAGGCASDLTQEEIANYEAEGAYADDDIDASSNEEDIASSSQALRGVAASYAYLWANSPTTNSYAPHAWYSFNSAGGAMQITRLGTGRYRVDLDELAAPGNTQVNAYGNNSHRCKLYGPAYSMNGGVRFDVYCFNYAGTLTDSMFVAFYNNTSDTQGRLALANVDAYGTHSHSTYVTDVTRPRTGVYRVIMPTTVDDDGTPFVTAIGSSGNFCNPSSIGWETTDNGSVLSVIGYVVEVRCFSSTGAAINSPFQFTYFNAPSWSGLNVASAVADSAADHPSSGYYSAIGQHDMVWFEYYGSNHAVTFYAPEFVLPSTSFANAFTTSAVFCKPQGWGTSTTQHNTTVICHDTTGATRTVRSSVAAIGGSPVTAVLLPFSS